MEDSTDLPSYNESNSCNDDQELTIPPNDKRQHKEKQEWGENYNGPKQCWMI